MPAMDAQSDDGISRRFLEDHRDLQAYCRALLGEPGAADDLVQDVFLALRGASDAGQPPRDVRTWCRGVARNLALKRWRTQRRTPVLVDSGLLAAVDRAFDETDPIADEWRRRRERLAGCLKRLAPAARRFIDAFYARNLPVADIAREQSKTPAAVMMALSRTRRRLQACIDTGSDAP